MRAGAVLARRHLRRVGLAAYMGAGARRFLLDTCARRRLSPSPVAHWAHRRTRTLTRPLARARTAALWTGCASRAWRSSRSMSRSCWGSPSRRWVGSLHTEIAMQRIRAIAQHTHTHTHTHTHSTHSTHSTAQTHTHSHKHRYWVHCVSPVPPSTAQLASALDAVDPAFREELVRPGLVHALPLAWQAVLLPEGHVRGLLGAAASRCGCVFVCACVSVCVVVFMCVCVCGAAGVAPRFRRGDARSPPRLLSDAAISPRARLALPPPDDEVRERALVVVLCVCLCACLRACVPILCCCVAFEPVP
jgi:hypothetical protein